MTGFHFTSYLPDDSSRQTFAGLLKLFSELLLHTSGDAPEALEWMKELNKENPFTSQDYTLDDFIKDLLESGYLKEKEDGLSVTVKMEQNFRQQALEQVFGKQRKAGNGQHRTYKPGLGDELSTDQKPYIFGDRPEQIMMTESLKNAQVNHGIDAGIVSEQDLVVAGTEHKSATSTVLMIDISHSMILYGEDRITPSKKVAMALAEMIRTRFKNDTLDIIVFGNEAWQISLADLPYLNAGPYHTNTIAGLELAMDILRKKKNRNRQIFMITDGKPSCMKEPDGTMYRNSFGLDRKILNKTLDMAISCRRLKIPVTTFMVANDPYLIDFVEEFSEANNGKAYLAGLNGLGNFLLKDFERNRSANIR